ncbi:unnamed protein product [Adineta ricciae]|uniref:Uncharacterized protein n=1 Tax=Adineta ricciae TaxID=249248 RepID=A0A813XPZ0_ADIRI|nr:unnamed protein product [Adineta ricciae]CAF0921673.1 unnamed protein product [Adineta ricciae]
MSRESISVSSTRSKHSEPSKYNRSLKPLARVPPVPDEILAQLLKFRIDGQSINARNVGEVYPGLDNLLVRCLRTGDDRQLNSRLNRNLKPEYLLITGKHIHISVCARTQDILENLISMGATLDLHFYEPTYKEELELMCKFGYDINERLPKYNNQTPISFFIHKNSSVSMFDVLVKNGARFDIQDDHGQTCLHIACQSAITDAVFEFIVNNAPDFCLNIRNQIGSTPLDLAYLTTYEQASLSRMRRLHLLLSRTESKLTRYGMREPNLLATKQYKLFDIIACKEFLLKYRLRDIFDPSVRVLTWCIFLFYDVLRACEQPSTDLKEGIIRQRLDNYLVSMIENGEISLNKLIFRPNPCVDNPFYLLSSTSNTIERHNSILHMAQLKNRLSRLRAQTLTLKALCRIKIKGQVQSYPNDIVKIDSISKILQAYLTFYNPFIKSDVTK